MLLEPRRVMAATAALREWTGQPFASCRHVLAPLRVCPLGAHIDHQGGRVTGLTLDRAMVMAFVPGNNGEVRLRSLDFDGECRFDLASIPPAAAGDWGNHARGAASELLRNHRCERGLTAVIAGSLPVGGLSSSAAVNIAYLLALEHANGLELSTDERIHLCQRIENGYVGVRSGLLDQSIILNARSDTLTTLDCSDFAFDWVTTPPTARYDLVIAYCGRSRALANSDYNSRVAECHAAAEQLLALSGGTAPGARLRDVPVEVYEAHAPALPPPLRRRAANFYGEMRRVVEGIAAWGTGDLPTFGRLMTESGHSSVVHYECGGPEMTSLWEILAAAPGVLGARFSGAGFRGSCLALAEPGCREAIAAHIAERYPVVQPAMADRYEVHFCRANGPAEVI